MNKLINLLIFIIALPSCLGHSQTSEKLDSLNMELSSINVKLNKESTVDWNATFTPVVSMNKADGFFLSLMYNAIKLISEGDSIVHGYYSMLYEQNNCTTEQINIITEYFNQNPLPSPYSWFCGLREHTLILGIKDTSNTFESHISEAKVSVIPVDNVLCFTFGFDNKDNEDIKSSFKNFTKQHLGEDIVTEINGEFIAAPRIYDTIEKGVVQMSASIPIIKKLFSPNSVAEVEECATVTPE